MSKIDADRLRTLLSYDPETGHFTWRADKKNSRGQVIARSGARAGGLNAGGYWQMVIDREHYFGHRLAWLYVHGEWPTNQIDHANGNPNDNRLCNLRIANHSQQRANQKLRKDSSTGVKGVYRHKSGLYCARCMRKGHPTFSAYFHSLEDAGAAYAAASKRMYGEFARIR